MRLERDKRTAGGWALLFTSVLAAMIVYGSRRLDHFDAALVGYTFATLFATFGITYRYAMWLQPAADADVLAAGLADFPDAGPPRRDTRSKLGRRFLLEFAANRFIFRRGAPARRRPLADHVGLHPRGGHHVSAGLGMDSFRDGPGQPRRLSHVRVRLAGRRLPRRLVRRRSSSSTGSCGRRFSSSPA